MRIKFCTGSQPVRSEFMLKFLLSSNQSAASVIHMLQNYKTIHEQKLENYLFLQEQLNQGIQEVTPTREKFLNAALRSGILSCEAMILWCDETIEKMKNGNEVF